MPLEKLTKSWWWRMTNKRGKEASPTYAQYIHCKRWDWITPDCSKRFWDLSDEWQKRSVTNGVASEFKILFWIRTTFCIKDISYLFLPSITPSCFLAFCNRSDQLNGPSVSLVQGLFSTHWAFFLSNVERLSNPQLIYPAPCPAYPLPGICGQSHLNCSLTTNISLALFFNMVSKWGSVKWCKLQAKSKFSIFQNLWIKFREAASSATAQTKTPGVQIGGSKGPGLANLGKKCWVVHFGTCGSRICGCESEFSASLLNGLAFVHGALQNAPIPPPLAKKSITRLL